MLLPNKFLFNTAGVFLLKSGCVNLLPNISRSVTLKVDEKEALIRLPSKVVISVDSSLYATLGKASNSNHKLRKLGKAGANR